MPRTASRAHASFVANACARLEDDPRFLAQLAAGSYATDTMDAYSDLDFVLVVDDDHYDAVMAGRHAIAAGLGDLLVCFTGEHVAEPRLLICLYGPNLLHVDLKFVRTDDLAKRVDDPVILWSRSDRVAAMLEGHTPRYPTHDAQWIEDRFWVWMHYGAAKIARGEYLDAHALLAYVRHAVLGPMTLDAAGATPNGVRRVETIDPAGAAEIAKTVTDLTPGGLREGLLAAIDLYGRLRERHAIERRERAQEAVRAYIASLDPEGDGASARRRRP